ncbi:MAG: DUF1232 domain-containing protein [Oscillospiraceae bacterium]|nr:DUF1232 domain-containing protein [Oscillospiraceae bacterium]
MLKLNVDSKVGRAVTAVAHGTGKTLEAINKASRKLEPLASLPIIGGTVADVQDIISMLDDYYHGRYKKLPVSVILGSVAIVAYLLSPFDIVPDNIPLLGFVDDAFIINIVLELCVDKELGRYRNWRTGAGT